MTRFSEIALDRIRRQVMSNEEAAKIASEVAALEAELHNERSTFKRRFRAEHREIILDRDMQKARADRAEAEIERLREALEWIEAEPEYPLEVQTCALQALAKTETP